MGIWSDLKNSFKLKNQLKPIMKDINSSNFVNSYKKCIKITNEYEISEGTKNNIIDSIQSDFISKLYWMDISDKEKEKRTNKILDK